MILSNVRFSAIFYSTTPTQSKCNLVILLFIIIAIILSIFICLFIYLFIYSVASEYVNVSVFKQKVKTIDIHDICFSINYDFKDEFFLHYQY